MSTIARAFLSSLAELDDAHAARAVEGLDHRAPAHVAHEIVDLLAIAR
jgi:Mn-dependent DtxR family transcriptional regulator